MRWLSASQARALASAAASLGPGASDGDRARGLAALRALDDDRAERWMIEARALAVDPEAAAQAAARAVDLCPRSAVAHNLLGNALQKTQKLERAEQEYHTGDRSRAAATVPALSRAALQPGLARASPRRRECGVAAFDEIARAQPTYPNVFLVRAEAHRRAGDVAAATADLGSRSCIPPAAPTAGSSSAARWARTIRRARTRPFAAPRRSATRRRPRNAASDPPPGAARY